MDTKRNGHAVQDHPPIPDIRAMGASPSRGAKPLEANEDMPVLPLPPLNAQEELKWWGARMPPLSRFTTDVRAHVDRLEKVFVKFPARALRLKIRALAAIQASEAFEEQARGVARELAARHERAGEPLRMLDERITQQITDRYEARKVVAKAEEGFAKAAGMCGLLLDDPLAPIPKQVASALADLLPDDDETAGKYALVPVDSTSGAAGKKMPERGVFQTLAPISNGLYMALTLGSAAGLVKLAELKDPTVTTSFLLAVAVGTGIVGEYGLGKWSRFVAELFAMHRDGKQDTERPDSQRGIGVVRFQAVLLAAAFVALSTVEGIGLRDMRVAKAQLGSMQDVLPLPFYCVVGGVISGLYLGWQMSQAYTARVSAMRAGVQKHLRRQEREAWLKQESAQTLIGLATLLPRLRADVEWHEAQLKSLREERARLAEPRSDDATLAQLDDMDKTARGERFDFMQEQGELIEALEPLQNSK